MLEAGIKECGFEYRPLFAVERDSAIAATYKANHGGHIICDDILNVKPEQLPAVDWFHASPVCCRFSTANTANAATGQERHAADNSLDITTATATASYIVKHRPKFVTIENVKQYVKSESLAIITRALDACGYARRAAVYKDCELGGYTLRERLILRATTQENALFPEPRRDTSNVGKWLELLRPYIDQTPRTVTPHYAEKVKAAVTAGKYDPGKTAFVNFRNSVRYVDAYPAESAAPTLTASSHRDPNMIHFAGEHPLQFHQLEGTAPWFALHGISKYECESRSRAIHISGNGIPRSFVERVMLPFIRQEKVAQLIQPELF